MTNKKRCGLVTLAMLMSACSISRTIDLGDVETKKLLTPDEVFYNDLKSPENKKTEKLKPINSVENIKVSEKQKEQTFKAVEVIRKTKESNFNNLKIEEEVIAVEEDENVKAEELKTIVEVKKKIEIPAQYITLISERLLNQILNETSLMNKNLYVMEVKTLASELPQTTKNSRKHLEKIIQNAEKYNLAGLLDQADFYIQPEVNALNIEDKYDIYQYKLDLFNKKGDKVGSWSDVIRKSVGDDTWW